MPAPTTPCPSCAAPIRVKAERGVCGACGQRVRFVEAPEAPCNACGAAVAFRPGEHAARCPRCKEWTADEPGRPVQGRATCPRCRRRIEVPLDAATTTCPHCRSALALQGTL